jgi:hypothetical protein
MDLYVHPIDSAHPDIADLPGFWIGTLYPASVGCRHSYAGIQRE